MSIMDKILDVKSLFSCYSASKQFAALVLQTRFVSVPIRYGLAEYSSDLVWPDGMLNFLKKLSCVERATVEFSPRDPNPYDSESFLFRWTSDSSGFILVSADEAPGGRFQLYERGFGRMEYQLLDSMSRVYYMEGLVAVFPNLKDVSAVDSMERGRLFLDVSEIMRKDKKATAFFSVRRWTVCLPFDGYAMKEVTLLTVRHMKDRYALVEENPFEQEEYFEVAKTLMTDYVYSETLILAPILAPFANLAWDALLTERNTRRSGAYITTGYSFKRDRVPPLVLEMLMESNCTYTAFGFLR